MKHINLLVLLVSLSFAVTTQASEKIYFVHTDHLGTPQALTDDQQNTVWLAGDDAFGNADPEVETVVNNIRFPGQYYDQETGLHYNWNRYYDPGTGRYVTSDPIGLDGGMNTYGYVGGNPITRIDPTGEAFFLAALPFVGGGGATAAGGGTLAGLGTTVLGGLGFAAMMSIPGDTPIGGTDAQQCNGDDPSGKDCRKATKSELDEIFGDDYTGAHDFKTVWGAFPNKFFDICICKDGSVVIRRQGQCGSSGPTIPTY